MCGGGEKISFFVAANTENLRNIKMIQIFVEAVKTICKWLLNRIFDIFLILLFLISLLVPWRIYGNVKQLATHASNLRTFRESCATVFGWSVWDAVCCPMLLVELCSWRCPHMLYHTYLEAPHKRAGFLGILLAYPYNFFSKKGRRPGG